MNIRDIIRTKRDGLELTKDEINFWVKAIVDETIPDYQTTALLMAIYLRGMSIAERGHLTHSMVEFGNKLNFKNAGFPVVDKHSTGGIGDKTSLILAPLLAEAGIRVPMISGRGLGFTGGTLDKLEAIPGYNVLLSENEMSEAIAINSSFIAGQTFKIAPADKKIYALRDVTETVDNIPLITASILSKKAAEGLDGLILDVKCGLGAFMKDLPKAEELAKSLVATAQTMGISCRAILSRMDFPIGCMIGNACETLEVIRAMTKDSEYCDLLRDEIFFNHQGNSYLAFRSDRVSTKGLLVFLTMELAIEMYCIHTKLTPPQAFIALREIWLDGRAFSRFEKIVQQQKGDLAAFLRQNQIIEESFSQVGSTNVFYYNAPMKSRILAFDGEKIGHLMVALGAGRKNAEDQVNHLVSLKMETAINQIYEKGDVILQLYHPNLERIDRNWLKQQLDEAISFESDLQYQDTTPLIFKKISH